MDIELLRTFLEVNRTRHFRRAAEELCVTQAAVSSRIKKLESLLNITLFDRNKREVNLTPEGNKLRRHAEKILADWRKARQEVTAGGVQMQLSVSSSPRLWDILLHKWLFNLRVNEPDIAITTYSIGPDAIIRQLLDGIVDLAFLLDPPISDSLQVKEVASLKLILVSNEPFLTSEEAMDQRFIMVDWGLAHALELQRAFPFMTEPFTRLATARLAFEYIKSLGGCAYLPMTMVNSSLKRKKLFHVQDTPVFERKAHAVYPVLSDRIELLDQVLALFNRPKTYNHSRNVKLKDK